MDSVRYTDLILALIDRHLLILPANTPRNINKLTQQYLHYTFSLSLLLFRSSESQLLQLLINAVIMEILINVQLLTQLLRNYCTRVYICQRREIRIAIFREIGPDVQIYTQVGGEKRTMGMVFFFFRTVIWM